MNISKGTAVARLYKARESLLMDKEGPMLLPKRSRYPGLPRDMESRFLQYAYEDFINRGSIVALRNAKVVKRRLNTLYGGIALILEVHPKRYGV